MVVAGGWRVGLRRGAAGEVRAGLLVPRAAAGLVSGCPAVSWRGAWAVVAAAAGDLRVVAGATVVAVVVVTVVVKSLGIQSATQPKTGRVKAGGGRLSALPPSLRGQGGAVGGGMAAERLGWVSLVWLLWAPELPSGCSPSP